MFKIINGSLADTSVSEKSYRFQSLKFAFNKIYKEITIGMQGDLIKINEGSFKPIDTTKLRHQILDMAYDHNGRRLLLATAKDLVLLDRSDNQKRITLSGHGGSINSACFSADGKRILSASADHTARIWDAEQGRIVSVLNGHQGRLRYGVFSPDSRRVLTASEDGTARLWDAERGQLLLTLTAQRQSVNYGFFLADGQRALTVGRSGGSWLWDLTQESLFPLAGEGRHEAEARLRQWLTCYTDANCHPVSILKQPMRSLAPETWIEMGDAALQQEDLEIAQAHYVRAQEAYRAASDSVGVTTVLPKLAVIAQSKGSFSETRLLVKQYREQVAQIYGRPKSVASEFLTKIAAALAQQQVPLAGIYCDEILSQAPTESGIYFDCLEVRLAGAQWPRVLSEAPVVFDKQAKPGLKSAVAGMSWAAAVLQNDKTKQKIWRRQLEGTYGLVEDVTKVDFHFKHSRPLLAKLHPAPTHLVSVLALLELLEKPKSADTTKQLKSILNLKPPPAALSALPTGP